LQRHKLIKGALKMSYTTKNFKSKKELKEALVKGEEVRCFQPGSGPDLSNFTGTVYLEGPHYPKPHRWYASAQLENGVVRSIK
jgi:hypothetical protein